MGDNSFRILLSLLERKQKDSARTEEVRTSSQPFENSWSGGLARKFVIFGNQEKTNFTCLSRKFIWNGLRKGKLNKYFLFHFNIICRSGFIAPGSVVIFFDFRPLAT